MLNDCSPTMLAEQLESGEEDGVDFTKPVHLYIFLPDWSQATGSGK